MLLQKRTKKVTQNLHTQNFDNYQIYGERLGRGGRLGKRVLSKSLQNDFRTVLEVFGGVF